MKQCIEFIAVLAVLFLIEGISLADSYNFERIIENGFNNTNNTEVFIRSCFNGYLYAGTRNSAQGCSIWRSADGNQWNIISQTSWGFGDANNTEIMAMCNWNNTLYASTRNSVTGTEIWSSADGITWTQVNEDGFGNSSTTKAREILPYQGKLIVVTSNYLSGGGVWASTNGANWSMINTSGFGDSNNDEIAGAVVFNGYLFCATGKGHGSSQGIEIWRYDGSSWQRTASGGFGDSNNNFPTTMIVFNNYLYVGTENNVTTGETWRSSDGYNWSQVGQISGSSYPPVFAPSCVVSSYLYGWGKIDGTYELYTTTDGSNWSAVLKPNGEVFNGGVSFSLNGILYASSFNGSNLNDVWRITPDFSPNGSGGNMITSDLWIRAVINTEEKGAIEAVLKKGGEDTTSRGDRVIWGHFYASPNDVTWGSQDNPDLFVKIWFDVSGRVDVNFFHVSVPDIEVYSDYLYDGTYEQQGTTTMNRRYIRQYYKNGQSYSDENYEDGNPPFGYSPAGNPFGYSTINDLRIGSIINTVEKGPVDAMWRLGGQDTTSRGDQVVWGHFYASPSDVTWGSSNNPDLFMKIWFDVSGRVDVNFFHVSVPDIEVYSDLPDDSNYDQKGTTIMDNRYIRHEYLR